MKILGQSAAIRQVLLIVQKACGVPVDVLVTGETGSGKELVARSIHEGSPFKSGPFVPVDCAAVPHELFENDFFGHQRGAFTGAQAQSKGLFEAANGGTLFLDEIGHLPIPQQTKLLRVLQERAIRHIGAVQEVHLHLRVVAATSMDLESMVRKGSFREDLFHRLNVIRIHVPPLRDRPDDIPLLATAFGSAIAGELNAPPVQLSADVLAAFGGYHWPGNIRELRNVLKRMIVMASGSVLTLEDVPPEVLAAQQNGRCGTCGTGYLAEKKRHILAFEKEYLSQLLVRHSGVVSRVAQSAKLPKGTLYRLISKHGIPISRFRLDAQNES